MGQLDNKSISNSSEKKQLEPKDDMTSLIVNIFLLLIIGVLFSLCIVWVFHSIDQLSLHQNLSNAVGNETIPIQGTLPAILGNLGISSILTWLLGIIGTRIANNIIDRAWNFLKRTKIKISASVKRRRKN